MINEFYPSQMVQDLYDFADNYAAGTNTYYEYLIDAIIDWFSVEYPTHELKTAKTEYAILVSFIDEHGHLQMEEFMI